MLNVTADNVKLALLDSAVTAWLSICTPIFCLLTVTNPIMLNASDDNSGLQLCSLYLLWPPFNHPLSLVDNELFFHVVRSGLTIQAQRRRRRGAPLATVTARRRSLQRLHTTTTPSMAKPTATNKACKRKSRDAESATLNKTSCGTCASRYSDANRKNPHIARLPIKTNATPR